MISQRQQISLHQKLSPQQIILMRLLQVPTISLEQTIKDELEKNPVLEEENSINEGNDLQETGSNEYDTNDYLGEDDIPSYKLTTNNYSHNDNQKEISVPIKKSFHEFLLEQLELQNLSEIERAIGVEIIGNIDDAGYLERNLNAIVNDFLFRQNIQIPISDVKSVLHIIQTFEPAGIASQSLEECLLLQLQRVKPKTKSITDAIKIIQYNFDSFTKKHYEKIAKGLRLSDEELKAAIDEITILNPKPGNNFLDSDNHAQYIIPDFIVYLNDNEKPEFISNNIYTPKLSVNKYYADVLQSMTEIKKKSENDKKAISFLKEKIESAKGFIDAIKQRENTLENTMQAILDYQKEFFINGDISKLKPMRLKEIADSTNLDISTISRVVNQKYAQTHFGTFLLKDFFSNAFTNDSGEDVATDSIKDIMIECIKNENKQNPLNDEELKDILNKKGFPLARRTVAKYRESLKIPVGRLRKE